MRLWHPVRVNGNQCRLVLAETSMRYRKKEARMPPLAGSWMIYLSCQMITKRYNTPTQTHARAQTQNFARLSCDQFIGESRTALHIFVDRVDWLGKESFTTKSGRDNRRVWRVFLRFGTCELTFVRQFLSSTIVLNADKKASMVRGYRAVYFNVSHSPARKQSLKWYWNNGPSYMYVGWRFKIANQACVGVWVNRLVCLVPIAMADCCPTNLQLMT